MNMENHHGMISIGETPDSSTTALWQSYRQSSSNKAGGTGKINEFCLTKYLFHSSKGSVICCKILHVVNAFTSPPKEGVLRIFITLKNPSL
jgi:hypothetical protein